MLRQICRALLILVTASGLGVPVDAEAARSPRSKKASIREKRSRGWVSVRKNSPRKSRVASASARRDPASSQRRKVDIQKKYAQLKRRLRDQQLQREEQLMRQLAMEERVGVRMENLRSLQASFEAEQEELNLQEVREMCQSVNAECHRIPGYQLANAPEYVPSFAQDTGFRDD